MTRSSAEEHGNMMGDSGSPIHLHVSEDAPIHLHFESDNQKNQSIVRSTGPKFRKGAPEPSHWIPPPAKTSTGRPPQDRRKVRMQAIRRSESMNSLCSDPGSARQQPEREHSRSPQSRGQRPRTAGRSSPISRRARSSSSENRYKLRFAEEPSDNLNWTTSVLNGMTKDIEKSTSRMKDAARSIEETFEEFTMENVRPSTRELTRVSRARDELTLHADMIARSARELCRWAESIRDQQAWYTNTRRDETMARESALEREVRALRQRLDNTTADLEETQNRLTELRSERTRANTINESLESLKGHLQRELRQKEAECSRLNIHVRNLEARATEERASLKARLEAAENNLSQLIRTKDALKRAARAQKRRADEAEQALARLAPIHTEIRSHRRPDGEPASEQESTLDTSKSYSQQRRHGRSTSSAGTRRNPRGDDDRLIRDNEQLRSMNHNYEQRLHAAEEEMSQLRKQISRCESTMHRYLDGDGLHRDAGELHDQLTNNAEQGGLTDLNEGEKNSARSGRKREDYDTGKSRRSGVVTSHSSVQQMSDQVPCRDPSPALVDELRRQLAEARLEKEQLERKAEVRMADLRAQLGQADATNRSLQAYLTFLKRSYASVFQPDLVLDEVQLGKQMQQEIETLENNLSAPSPRVTTRIR